VIETVLGVMMVSSPIQLNDSSVPYFCSGGYHKWSAHPVNNAQAQDGVHLNGHQMVLRFLLVFRCTHFRSIPADVRGRELASLFNSSDFELRATKPERRSGERA
jgi:hypothetical protein